MVTLKDYLGSIIADLAAARANADVESLKIAEIYASNPLLKNFPVPRMRITNFTVNTPIVIEKPKDVEIKKYNEDVSGKEFQDLINDIFKKTIDSADPPLTDKQKNIIEKGKNEALKRFLKRFPTKVVDPKSISSQFIENTQIDEALPSSVIKPDTKKEIMDELKSSLRVGLARIRTLPALDIIPNSLTIKEYGQKDLVTYLSITINEDALQWDTYQADSGKTSERLITE